MKLLLDPSHHTSGCERRSASCLEPCGLMDRGAGTDAALRLPLRLRAPALPAPLEPNLRLRADPMVGVATRPASWPCVARDAACGKRICMRCTQLFVSSKAKSVNPRPSTGGPATASTDHRGQSSEPAQSTEPVQFLLEFSVASRKVRVLYCSLTHARRRTTSLERDHLKLSTCEKLRLSHVSPTQHSGPVCSQPRHASLRAHKHVHAMHLTSHCPN